MIFVSFVSKSNMTDKFQSDQSWIVVTVTVNSKGLFKGNIPLTQHLLSQSSRCQYYRRTINRFGFICSV